MSPLFHTAALHSYVPAMNEAGERGCGRRARPLFASLLSTSSHPRTLPCALHAAGRLLEHLDSTAGDELDVHALLGRMTLEVIGTTTFGCEAACP